MASWPIFCLRSSNAFAQQTIKHVGHRSAGGQPEGSKFGDCTRALKKDNLALVLLHYNLWLRHISACVYSNSKLEVDNPHSAARSFFTPWTLFKTQTGTEWRSFFSEPGCLTWPSRPNTYPVFWSIFGSVVTEKLPKGTGSVPAEEWRLIRPVHLSPTSPLLLLTVKKPCKLLRSSLLPPAVLKTHEGQPAYMSLSTIFIEEKPKRGLLTFLVTSLMLPTVE